MDTNDKQSAASPSGAGIEWRREDAVATVTIANPGHHNAITIEMWRLLKKCFQEIAGSPGLRVVVMSGAQGAFAAGADISEFKTARVTRDQVRHFHQEIIAPALASIAHCPIPVIAAIDGACVGGGLEILSVCDLRVASDRSRFGIPIQRLGFPMAPAEAAGLLSLARKAVALELLLEGRIFDAHEAYEKGLLTRVVPLALWEEEVRATAQRVAQGAPHAARRNKWLIQTLSGGPSPDRLSPLQQEACWDFVETQDYQRGVDAFLKKSPPRFEDN
jgi:enoyl-CoA hydratase/carnithine racemase